MNIETIASLALLVAASIAACAFFALDIKKLKHNNFNSKEFYDSITSTDEAFSIKRIIVLAMLVALFTQLALTSQWVVLIIAAVVLILGIALLLGTLKTKPRITSRIITLAALQIVLAAAIVVVVGITNGIYYAGVAALAIAAFSYAITLAVNAILPHK
ncbi:MAG: hypothetical protein IK092_03530 [Muribaculaceae bacterium]|nr:hypothetical protein [Muribaculaceae bacterium]